MKILEILTESKKENTPKSRDPGHRVLAAKRSSGAMGAHRDKKKEAKQGKVKHKKQPIDEVSKDSLKSFTMNLLKKHPSIASKHPIGKDVARRKALDLALDKIYPKSAIRPVKVKATEDDRSSDNFTLSDIKDMEKMKDLEQMKMFAKKLIATPSKKPMRPEKVSWFNKAIDSKRKPIDLIKLMYDLLLSGEGNSVYGSKHSTDPNSYRKTFGEESEIKKASAEKIKHRILSAAHDMGDDWGNDPDTATTIADMYRLDPKFVQAVLKGQMNERADDNGNTHCWTGYRKVGLKKKGGKMVNDCRPVKKGKK